MSLNKILVGYSGFVGSNLIDQTRFDGIFNSSNIEDSFGCKSDILIYSGVRAEKFLANSQPEKDFEIIKTAIENIKKIDSKKLILISTVDVYPIPQLVHENSLIEYESNQAYGKNRLYLERWVEENIEDYLIVRLPALFGKNLKKNFIYDLIHIVPAMLSEQKFLELAITNQWINDYYTKQENAFYKLNPISADEKEQLKEQFLSINFSALNFTDSRSIFQFYNLNHLWSDISMALQMGIKKLNLATEPISANEIYESVFGKKFKNEIAINPPHYNFHSIHAIKFNDSEKYIRNKESLLNDIQLFIKENK
ncbi:MAG TPA: NAD-dependent epimerase/dehydratase family protein [Flavobacterium sp.]|uniref:NAD-dependent epimerase/dehydratase family protein n=1 Tax=unclassified Flavobacterium TaxID=196869 RepID=UPI0025BDD862|nr:MULTISPECIES: NAD-dependent epimerase/dehydratase family protein [unclassified Flavobacterium]HRE77846.1 NAD-dependent epimerase/dehydratase family protein [Flavobacterium sp.]